MRRRPRSAYDLYIPSRPAPFWLVSLVALAFSAWFVAMLALITTGKLGTV